MVDRRFSAGFWAALEEMKDCERLPVFPFSPASETAFRAWHAEHKPDAILCINHEVKKWLETMGVKVPEEVGLAHLDWHDGLPDWGGMHQNNTLVGVASIDMLVGQLHRNEFGLPKFSKASLIESTWVDGPSLARRIASESPGRPRKGGRSRAKGALPRTKQSSKPAA